MCLLIHLLCYTSTQLQICRQMQTAEPVTGPSVAARPAAMFWITYILVHVSIMAYAKAPHIYMYVCTTDCSVLALKINFDYHAHTCTYSR